MPLKGRDLKCSSEMYHFSMDKTPENSTRLKDNQTPNPPLNNEPMRKNNPRQRNEVLNSLMWMTQNGVY